MHRNKPGEKPKAKWPIIGRPLEEVDPFIFQKTYCVLAKRCNKNYIYRFSTTKSLFFFGPFNPIRRLCVYLITHPLFEIFIFLSIIGNCIAIAFDDNEFEKTCDMDDNCVYTLRGSPVPPWVEWFFLGLYILEMVLKVVAKGFVFNKYSYLRNGWNVVDFVVIIVGLTTETLSLLDEAKSGGVDLHIFKTFRVFRAMKTIAILPGLRALINALVNAVVQLTQVLGLTFFTICVFALFALEVFTGKLHQVCVLNKGSDTAIEMYEVPTMEPISPLDPLKDYEYERWISNEFNWLARDFPDDQFVVCGNETGSRQCPEDYTCLPYLNQNPDSGWISFDNFLYASLSTLQLITLDYWERLYDLIMSSAGAWTLIFFVLVVFLGSFYLLNLMLAVVSMSYEAETDRQEKEKIKKRDMSKYQKLAIHRKSSCFSFDQPFRLHIAPLTNEYAKKTPKEREKLARELRSASVCEAERLSGKKDVYAVFMKQIAMKKTAGFALLSPEEKAAIHKKEAAERAQEAKKKRDLIEKEELKQVLREVLRKIQQGEVIADSCEVKGVDNKGKTKQIEVHQTVPTNGEAESAETEEEEKVKKSVQTAKRKKRKRYDRRNDLIQYYDSINWKESESQYKFYDCTEKELLTSQKLLLTRPIPYQHESLLAKFVHNKYFEGFITSCIILNTAFLAAEHHREPEWLTRVITQGSHWLTGVFTLEAIIKIIGLRSKYFNENWNIFDLIIVISSNADLFSEQLGGSEGFRVMRLFRILKLAQSWLTMRILLNIIFSTFGALGYLTFLLAIVIYMFAVLGMQVVGTSYTPANFNVPDPEDNDFPRWSFRNFLYSFMMIFRVLCGEWIEPLWECFQAHSIKNEEWKCFSIFLLAYIIGNIILLNLFLALLLNSFTTEELNAQREKATGQKVVTDSSVELLNMNMKKAKVKKKTVKAMSLVKKDEYRIRIAETDSKRQQQFKRATLKIIMSQRKAIAEGVLKRIALKVKREQQIPSAKVIIDIDKAGSRPRKIMTFARNQLIGKIAGRRKGNNMRRSSIYKPLKANSSSDEELRRRKAQDRKFTEPPDCCSCSVLPTLLLCARRERTHCLCDVWRNLRACALKIVSVRLFEWTILLFIIASSITLCFEDIDLEDNPDLLFNLFIINAAFTIIFLVEMILKWMAFGLHEYFTNFWTIIDGIIAMVSVVSLIFDTYHALLIHDRRFIEALIETQSSQSWAALKSLRTFKALRPLRAISRWQGMKVVVNALVFAIPSIVNVLLVCLMFWLIFAIMGVNLFKGKFFKCIYNADGSAVSHHIVKDRAQCCGEYSNDTKYAENATSWTNTRPNFDNVFWAYLSLFQVATFEGWMEIMSIASDVTEVDHQPIREASYLNYMFFVVFIIFGSFFTLNLFIGVIIDNFNLLKKKYEGDVMEAFLSENQMKYYRAMKKLRRKKPSKVVVRPISYFVSLVYDVSLSRRFEIVIFCLIFANMIGMALEFHGQSTDLLEIVEAFNGSFAAAYVMEAVIKLIGQRQYYFTIPWNVFDFFLVLLSVFDWFIGANVDFPFPPTLLRVVRVIRVGRVLRLIKCARGIRKLLFALVVSLPALFNVGALLSLILFVYAILGMTLFKEAPKIEALDDYFSFETFFKSSALLFRLQTSAGWNEVLDSLLIESHDEGTCGSYRKMECGNPGEPDCVSELQAISYMVSFLMITFLIVINMYIAIILENFEEANRDEEMGLVDDDIDSFYIKWGLYDPFATQFISFGDLSELLDNLDRPLRAKKPNAMIITSLDIPVCVGDKLHCLEVLKALVHRALGKVPQGRDFKKIQRQMEKDFKRKYQKEKVYSIVSSTISWKIHVKAALVIQRAWKTYKKLGRLRVLKELDDSDESRRTSNASIRSQDSDVSDRRDATDSGPSTPEETHDIAV